MADLLAALLNSTYARIQSKAGRTLGVEPGEAWRAALEAATEAGSGAVLLADRPIAVTQRRMADDMLGPAGEVVCRVGWAAGEPKRSGVAGH